MMIRTDNVVTRLMAVYCLMELYTKTMGFGMISPQISARSMRGFGQLVPRLNMVGNDDNNVVGEMAEDRKANLFQCLLRDLQIEGVPVLGCDADQVHTLSAALWTTLAEMSEQDEDQKVCVVMENIPIEALQAFVDDFVILKTQRRLMDELPELERISVSIVGKGAGPAFVLEVSKRTEAERQEKGARSAVCATLREDASTAALKSFVNRVVIGMEACPYTKTAEFSAVGLEAKGVTPGPVGYRFSPSSDACMALASFWNCVCELLSVPETAISTTVLSLPAIGYGASPEAHNRFAAVMELVSRNLCLYRGDSIFGLVHFHPAYDRALIHPVDKPSYGHLPPRSWLRPMLHHIGNHEMADTLTEEQLALSDYQRRSPHTAINILRTSQLNAASGAKSIVDLDVGNGVLEKASGITTYTRNAIRLANAGKEALDIALQADMEMGL